MGAGVREGRPKEVKPKEAYEFRLYHEAGVTVKHIAAMHGYSEATVYRELRRLRKLLGPEKLDLWARTRVSKMAEVCTHERTYHGTKTFRDRRWYLKALRGKYSRVKLPEAGEFKV